MAAKYLHEYKEFPDLLRIVGDELGVLPFLVEKDYWLMHVLYGLKKQGFDFKLKGGTSLSKGYKIINRFSEDIDIYITPPAELEINEKSTKDKPVEKRKKFYDWLSEQIKIDGILEVKRDYEFDDTAYYRSGGVRLFYQSHYEPVAGIKEGILLEAGFDTVTPFESITISSWAYDKASANKSLQLIDNRAIDIPCYHPGYTFVEKLQTITRKFRLEKESGIPNKNFMRQYYDLYCLLEDRRVLNFIGTDEYINHKKERFKTADSEIPIAENEAFLLADTDTRKSFTERYKSTSALYYKGQPPFEEVLDRIQSFLGKL